MTTQDTAATAADPTGPAAGATGGQPDYQALWRQTVADLETANKRFTGLQGRYQQEQAKWQSDAARLGELQQQMQSLSGDKEVTAIRASDLEKLLGQKDQELTQAQRRLERISLVATEFPQLLPLESKGLLPNDTGDGLKAKLQELASLIQGLGSQGAAEMLKGATPPAPPTGVASSPQTPDALWRAALEARNAGDMKRYDELYSAWLKAKQTAAKK